MMQAFLTLWDDQRGVMLVMTLVMTGLLSALAAAYSLVVRTDATLRGAAGRERQGFYAAEAGLNFAMAEVRGAFDDFDPPEAYSDWIAVGSGAHERTIVYDIAPVPGRDPGPPTVIPVGQPFAGMSTFPSDFAVTAVSQNSEGDAEATLGAQFTINSVPIFQFLAFYANTLEILPGPNMNLTGRIHTNADLYLSSADTLTIGDLPSPPNPPPGNPFVQVSAAGRIFRGHSVTASCGGTVVIDKLEDSEPDGDLDGRVLPCSGGATAQVSPTEVAAYQGSLLAGVPPVHVPPVETIQRGSGNLFWDQADLRIVLNLQAPRVNNFCGQGLLTPGLFPIEVQNTDGSRNNALTTSLWQFMCERRGAIFYNDRPTGAVNGNPSDGRGSNPGNYDPDFAGSNRIYRRVGEDTNGNGVINDNDSNPDICPAGNPLWKPSYCTAPGTWFNDTDYRRGGYYDHREDRWMYLLNVNMRVLIEWNAFNGGPLFPPADTTDGGLVIFLSVQGPASGGINNYGVRVFDSADLDIRNTTFPPGAVDPTGLTVVSDQAIYVQGNYNTVNKYPAALIGDTLNVLSQSWEVPQLSGGNWRANDRKSLSNDWDHRRVLTQDNPCGSAGCGGNLTYGINAGFIASVDNTVGAAYGGGLENYPRFHENWNNRTLVYRGSYVSLGTPLHANGAWSIGNPVYLAPGRDWNYDVAFNNVALLPPLTPTVNMLQQRVYTRFYH